MSTRSSSTWRPILMGDGVRLFSHPGAVPVDLEAVDLAPIRDGCGSGRWLALGGEQDALTQQHLPAGRHARPARLRRPAARQTGQDCLPAHVPGCGGQASEPRRASSSSVRRSASAATFSARCVRLLVLGIASTWFPCARVQASRTCAGVAPCARATARIVPARRPACRLPARRRRSRRTERTRSRVRPVRLSRCSGLAQRQVEEER